MLLLFHNGHVVFGVQRKTWIAGVAMRIFEQGSTERLYEVSEPSTRVGIEVDIMESRPVCGDLVSYWCQCMP